MGYCQGDGGDDDAAACFCFVGAQNKGVPGGLWHGELGGAFFFGSSHSGCRRFLLSSFHFFLTAFARPCSKCGRRCRRCGGGSVADGQDRSCSWKTPSRKSSCRHSFRTSCPRTVIVCLDLFTLSVSYPARFCSLSTSSPQIS